MRALIATAVGRVEVGDVPAPEIGPSQVLVRTTMSGVSAGTERRKLYSETLGKGDVRDPWPVVGAFGYMAVGEIVAVGADVIDLEVGDRVHAGRPFGGHREFIDVDATSCLKVPDAIDDPTAACMYWAVPPLLGLLAAEPAFYEDAAVVGLGPLGLCGVQLLEQMCRRIVAIDPLPSRRALAGQLGAAATFDPTAADSSEQVRAVLPGGPQVVLEVSGSQAGLETALSVVRPRGRVALVGSQRPLNDFDLFWPLQHSGARIVPIHRPGSASPQAGGAESPSRRYLPDVIDMLLRGRLRIEPLISRIVSVEGAADALEHLHRNPDEGVGMAIDWRSTKR